VQSPEATLTIGLTGGIGSGKSTVAAFLVGCGAHLIDADAISRQLTAPGGAAIAPLAQAFGPEMMAADGALNRSLMRERVFGNEQAKQRLEAILHPLIAAQTQQQAAAALLAGAKALVFDVPLLAESATWRARVSRVLVVDCLEQTQIDRVAQRPGWTAELARQVVRQQATRAARRAVADGLIHNEGLSLAQVQSQVQQLWQAWSAKAPALT
jgi:dephospho-CoA kinase